jgi:CheY-like chemotaxis protein
VTPNRESDDVLGQHVFAGDRTLENVVGLHGLIEDAIEAAYAAIARGETVLRGVAGPPTPHVEAISAPHQPVLAPATTPSSIPPVTPGTPSRTPSADTALGVVRLKRVAIRRAPAPVATLPPDHAARVLLVEDDAVSSELIGRALQKDGCEVAVSSTLAQAQAVLLGPVLPDLIVLDGHLPDGNGFTLCAQLKSDARFANIPVVLTSAIHLGAGAVMAAEEAAGADAFVEKPIDLRFVRALISHLLRRAPVAPAQKPDLDAIELAIGQAEAFLTIGDDERALVAIDQWLQLDPSSGQGWLERAHLLADKPWDAYAAYRRAVVFDALSYPAWWALARASQHLGLKKRAAAAYLQAANFAPNDDAKHDVMNALAALQ